MVDHFAVQRPGVSPDEIPPPESLDEKQKTIFAKKKILNNNLLIAKMNMKGYDRL
jgi:hypothetical protein